MSDDFVHKPVLLDRIVDLFSDVPAGLFVDATLGGAGHARAVLQANPGLHLLGLDRDEVAQHPVARLHDQVSCETEPIKERVLCY